VCGEIGAPLSGAPDPVLRLPYGTLATLLHTVSKTPVFGTRRGVAATAPTYAGAPVSQAVPNSTCHCERGHVDLVEILGHSAQRRFRAAALSRRRRMAVLAVRFQFDLDLEHIEHLEQCPQGRIARPR
jgi:hypothetical protein